MPPYQISNICDLRTGCQLATRRAKRDLLPEAGKELETLQMDIGGKVIPGNTDTFGNLEDRKFIQ